MVMDFLVINVTKVEIDENLIILNHTEIVNGVFDLENRDCCINGEEHSTQ